MSLLNVSHRDGLSSYTNHKQRKQIFGENIPPKGQNILKTSFIAESDFTINLLLYIITLRFSIKILFIRDGLEVQSILDQCISFILLLVMTLLKAMVNIQFFKMDQTQRKYRNQEWIKIKRDGQIVEIQQKAILVGDIIISNAQDVIRIDGILLNAIDLSINQSQTILRQDARKKQSFFNFKQDQKNILFDPFILAGSSVIYGYAQILVCKVGEDCSFRIKNQKIQAYMQTTPLISQLKKVLNFVQYSSKIIVFLCSTYFAVYYLSVSIQQRNLSWHTFLIILKTYSSYIGFVCLVQRLKIVRSLQFFLESCRSDKHFRVKNKCTLERLSQIDLIIIDKEALHIIDTERGFIMPKLDFISYLNKYFNVKIVSTLKIQRLLEQFDLYDSNGQITMNEDKFYKNKANQSEEQKIQKLKKCYFITEFNKQALVNELIPIYESLQYRICYIFKIKKRQSLSNISSKLISSNILTIAFIEQNSQIQTAQKQGNMQFWVKIKNTPIVQDHIQDIMDKGYIFAQLYNLYMTQFLNNIIIFLFLCYISIKRGYTIDFYWSLIIIITARYIFFKIYKKIVLDRVLQTYQTISHKKIIKYNFFLFFYYFYVVFNVMQKINIVLFFLCNAVLRTEIMLSKTSNLKNSIKNLIKINLITFSILAINLFIKIWEVNQIQEQIFLFKYVFGLSIILTIYGYLN